MKTILGMFPVGVCAALLPFPLDWLALVLVVVAGGFAVYHRPTPGGLR